MEKTAIVLLAVYTSNSKFISDKPFYRFLNDEISNDTLKSNDLIMYYVVLVNMIINLNNSPLLNDFTVYRGESYSLGTDGIAIFNSLKSKLQPNTFIRHARFWSTSTSEKQAKKYAQLGMSNSIYYTIKVRKDIKHFLSVKDYSEFQHEDEVLFVPYSLFYVESVKEVKGYNTTALYVDCITMDNKHSGTGNPDYFEKVTSL